MSFFRHYLRPGDNVIDAGANIGLYSLLFAQIVGQKGKIIAFEPDPVCAARLRENMQINGVDNVVVREVAVSDRAGTAQFSVGEGAAGAFADLRKAPATRTVSTVRIADEIGDLAFAAGKMDVEGAEPLALAGAMLERHNPPVWTIELTRKTLRRSGTELDDMVTMLRDKGFGLWRYDPDSRSLNEWHELPRKPGHIGDAIAIAEGHLPIVRERLRGN
jgi:FkbM family methyltransferase